MRISGVRSAERRAKHLSISRKKLSHWFRRPGETVSVFVFGRQRSGTSMLMRCFHLHPDMEVFDEARKNKAFLAFRIRGLTVLKDIVRRSRYPFVCFKPLVETHRVLDFMDHFPGGRFLWMFRDYRSVAASLLARFGPEPSNVLRSICRGKHVSGVLAERVTRRAAARLESLPEGELSDSDCACLSWWVNNWILIEKNLQDHPNVQVLKFEALLDRPADAFRALFEFLGCAHVPRVYRYVSAAAVGRHRQEPVHPDVARLCDKMMDELDLAFARQMQRS